MTSDLDELRALLRARAVLAPAPDDLLPHTRRLARGRRTRRRITLTAGVIVVTALALVGANLIGYETRDLPAVLTGPALPPPVLPFTVGFLPAGYQLSDWSVSPGAAAVTYAGGQGTDLIGVEANNHDPAEGRAGLSTPVHGRVATLLTDHEGPVPLWQLSWPAAPGRWLVVSAPVATVPTATVWSIANSVTLVPTPLPFDLHVANLPDNLQVVAWQGDIRTDSRYVDVALCRPSVHYQGPPAQPGCVDLQADTGAGPTPPFPNSNGQVVVRRIDRTHWVTAHSADLPMTLLTELTDLATVS